MFGDMSHPPGSMRRMNDERHYLVKAASRFSMGKMRTSWITHHRDCGSWQVRQGGYRPAAVAMSDLPTCCAALDVAQPAEKAS